MPYSLMKSGKGWKVVKDSDGRVLGEHGTRAKAIRQMRAVHASENRSRWRKSNFS